MPFSTGFFYAGICLYGFGLATGATYQDSNADPAFADCFTDCDYRTAITKPRSVSFSRPDRHCANSYAGANPGCYHTADCHVCPGDEYQPATSYSRSDTVPGSN